MSGRAGTAAGGATGSPGPAVPEEHRSGAGPALPAREGPAAPCAEWPLRSHLALGALPGAVPSARLHARQVVWECGLAALADTVELVVSELVTNAVQASAGITGSRYRGRWTPGRPPVRLWLCSDGTGILVQVWDGNEHPPARKIPAEYAPGGRGLLLVEALSATWGNYRPDGATGKVVWAIVTTAVP